MKKVLIIGATGNVGLEVLNSLSSIDHQLDIYAGVRNIEASLIKLKAYPIHILHFDFEDLTTYQKALDGCDYLFLVRPPQIADVSKYFGPLLEICIEKKVKHIVFLSVQGVEKSKIIPHHKIEKLIIDSNIPYTFLRPAYFMQNFTTTLRKDIVQHKMIYLPAGHSKFTLIDVADIGGVASTILTNIGSYINKSYELTNQEKLTFIEMADILSKNLGTKTQFKSPNLISFFLKKREEKLPVMLILVMIMLHYFPRFQKEPDTTDWVAQLTKKQAITFDQFVIDNRKLLMTLD